jgi:hypothetical protein
MPIHYCVTGSAFVAEISLPLYLDYCDVGLDLLQISYDWFCSLFFGCVYLYVKHRAISSNTGQHFIWVLKFV